MKKEPNKDLYDIGESLKLWCQAEGGGVAYELTWYKLNTTGSFVKHSSKSNHADGTSSEIVSIEKMTDAKATYKCVIRRYQVNYINYKLVKIVLKGNDGLSCNTVCCNSDSLYALDIYCTVFAQKRDL